ncbi:hypothetical protein Tco_0731591 [Tanacetum coccineum]
MRALRLRGVATQLNYSIKDVDEEREMEAPPEIRSQPSGTTREPIMGNIPINRPTRGYYDGKGDPDDFIHAFEGATKMEKWVMPVSGHMFVYKLEDAARVWWNNLPKGVVSNYEDLKRRKGKAKKTDIQLGEWIASAGKAKPSTEGKEEPILMIGVVNNLLKSKEPPKIMSIEEMIYHPYIATWPPP